MIRVLTGVIASLLLSSAAWSQVVFAPPEPCCPTERVVTDSRELIWSWRRSQCNMICNNFNGSVQPQVYVQSGILIIPSGNCISPESLGVDPLTGQPLYFRKRDLLPPMVPAAETSPATQRTKRVPPATPPAAEHQGELVIKPWQGGGGKPVSR